MTDFDRAALQTELQAGAEKLNLPLSDQQIRQMLDYLALLRKWNAVYNLTAVRDPKDMIKQHVLDSLSAAPAFSTAQRILDVGSGGGLPGVILAIVYPQIQVALIDTVSKKTAFLNQAKAELGLSNLSVFSNRVEKLQVPEKFDVITSRAFSELKNFINWSAHLLQEGGRFLAMKGVYPSDEVAALPEGWQVVASQELHVPGLEAERHLLIIQRV